MAQSDRIQKEFFVDNNEGWKLYLRSTFHRRKLDKTKRPLVIIPGYAMNSYIFGYHPTGLSMEEFFAEEGLEVWSVDLRAQGRSQPTWGNRKAGFWDLAITDLSTIFNAVLQHTQTNAQKVDAIGASLGGTLLYIHTSLNSQHLLNSFITMGSPLQWVELHPLSLLLFFSPTLAGMFPIRGMRTAAKIAYPILLKIPPLLKLYLHPEIVNTQNIDEMFPTVDDPNPKLNQEIAHWLLDRKLIVKGIDIYKAMHHVTIPLLCILANDDGLVLPKTAQSGYDASGSPSKKLLLVGSEKLSFAHADLFISNYSHDLVFTPIAQWLKQLP